MPLPAGLYGRLFWIKETTPGTFLPVSATTGLRPYFSSPLNVDVTQEPAEVEEITGVNSADFRFIALGVLGVRGRIAFPIRYSGVHAVMAGWALGGLASTAVTPFVHTAKTTDDYNSASLTHQMPVDSAATPTMSENKIAGVKVARARWSHRVGEPAQCELDWVATEREYTTTEDVTVPPDDGVFSPGEPMVNWDRMTTVITFDRVGGPAAITLDGVSWEVEADNRPEQLATFGTSRKLSVPARSRLRRITGRFEVGHDVGYEDVLDAFGLTLASGVEEASITFVYTDAADANLKWTVEISNVTITAAPSGTPTAGPVTQSFSFAARFRTGGTFINPEPIVMKWQNITAGPGGGFYGDLI